MSYIIGKKIGMTQIFDDNGKVIPVTVVEASPMTVIQKKTNEVDGYNAVKFGSGKAKSLNNPDKGQFEKIDKPLMKHLKEYRTDDVDKFELGSTIVVSDMFNNGDLVDVSGISKGKVFRET